MCGQHLLKVATSNAVIRGAGIAGAGLLGLGATYGMVNLMINKNDRRKANEDRRVPRKVLSAKDALTDKSCDERVAAYGGLGRGNGIPGSGMRAGGRFVAK